VRIKSIRVINFQRHRRLVIHLDDVTVIRGETDAGKSAVLRALRWLCLNDFAGANFIRRGAKRAAVSVRIIHNKQLHEITRERSASNTYRLDGEIYKAFGANVPDNIANLLRLSDVNFASQHDGPFWFCETAPEVSRKLNAIVDLSVIDSSLSHVAKVVTTTNTELVVHESRLESIREDLKTTQPERIKAFDLLHEIHRDERAVSRRIVRLKELIEASARLESQTNTIPSFSEIEMHYKKLVSIQQKVDSLQLIVKRIREAQQNVDTAQKRAVQAEREFKQQTQGKPCPICGSPMK